MRNRMKTFYKWISLGLLGLYTSIILLFIFRINNSPHRVLRNIANTSTPIIIHPIVKQACVHPELKPFDQHILKFVKEQQPIKCEGKSDWVDLSHGMLKFKIPLEFDSKYLQCKLSYIERNGDFYIKYAEPEHVDKNKDVVLKKDHFKITCTLNSTVVYERIHTTIAPIDSRGIKELNMKSNQTKYDVFILGFDSISRMNFIRNLPKSYQYFTSTMSAQIMTGYNIVGDGTFRNIVPFVTGKAEKDLPNTLKSNLKSKPVDVYPLIWKKFAKEGYVTSLAEDCAYIGTFAYRRTGFHNQPTHHYMRPFHLAVEELDHGANKEYKEFCVGSHKKVDIFFDYVKNFWSLYHPDPRFMFAFHSEQSHSDNINLSKTLDSILLDMLITIHTEKEHSKTILILMSDHGSRFSEMRSTLQGKQEERLPFLGLALPKILKDTYPQIVKDLQMNSGKLCTPHDVHATLLHILYLNIKKPFTSSDQKSKSLFQEIPINRTCEMAGIDEHWCACLDWIAVDPLSDIVRKLSSHIIDYINSLLKDHGNICHIVSLHNVTRAMQLVPKDRLLKFRKSLDDDKLHESFKDNTPIKQTKYQVWLITHPGHAYYEVTLTYIKYDKSIKLSSENVSRLDKYGHTADCITENKMDLRKYCYCK